MATDPATTPLTYTGQLIFGVGLGLLTVLIQTYMNFFGGSILALVIMNLTSPFLDRIGKLRPSTETKEPKLPKPKQFTKVKTYACIRCGACMRVCCHKLSPILIKEAFDKQNVVKLVKLNADYCTGCGHCSYICPARIDLKGSVLRAKAMLRTEQTPEPEPQRAVIETPKAEPIQRPVKETMERGSKITDIEGIGPVHATKLNSAGIYTTSDLLDAGATPLGRKELATKTGIADKPILEWVNMADLFRIKGVGEEYANLLEESGVDTVAELAKRVPENLHAKLGEVNEQKKLVRRLPTLNEVKQWIEEAKTLPRKIEY
jgi:predicted flap endonuclease-1-like 5' DNA nuclease/NAD-dependent dihydropyrimidine dehydrogenase PreA subunit